MKIKVLLFFVFWSNLIFSAEDKSEYLWFPSKPNIILLSYQRSGNTWLRYCLEYLTKRPSLCNHLKNKINSPIGNIIGWEIDKSKSCIWKFHHERNLTAFGKSDPSRDLLILLVRNYKECIPRQVKRKANRFNESVFYNLEKAYLSNISVYEKWNPSNRLMIYYEDLILNPYETLKSVLFFIKDSDVLLNEFIQNYLFHKKESLKIYDVYEIPNKTKGDSIIFHSKFVSDAILQKMDRVVMEKYPLFFRKYLHRYLN